MEVRLAGPGDGDALAAIYGPVVAGTAVSFEVDPPDGAEMARRVSATLPRHPWLVMDGEGAVVGYAYAHRFQARAAYDWAVETSIYVDEAHRGCGVGRSLYHALIAVLTAQGYHRAIAGIALPNPASVRLHESVGFRAVGVYHRVGWKSGAWHDVGMWELDLQTGAAPASAAARAREVAPAAPVPVDRLPLGSLLMGAAP
ncbi:MAG TPA: arsinothricin resistance N-acetyltransferase ArsN1 family B [Acidimicrobiales bacterium]|nr:arsinothricin resistance N-acetyltransferase ArsN1 family B [Acidimicrobiales bacterium]